MASKFEHKIVHGNMKAIEQAIEPLEEDGWELVNIIVDHHCHGKFTAIFKRIKSKPGFFG